MRTRPFLLALANKYVYSPLVGLTRTVAPSGTTADYAYDSANRLVSVRRNGTEIQTVSYRIGQDADNRVTVSDVIRGNSKHVRLSQFDGLGRLIKTTDSSTGVSFSRKYDAMGRLYGESAYGLLDDLTFSYPSQSSQLETVTSASEGTDFYGRVGFPLSGSQYTWNDAGLMASDSGFGITKISYNDFGLPTRMSTQNRSNYTTYAYSADGQLLERKKFSPGSSPFRANSTGSVYSADRIFTTSTEYINLNSYISYFPGGYFDSSGGVHYIHLDYQGSVVMETDSAGHIEKHRGYYPYGEPWAESTNKKTLAASVAQPQTYQSKERTAATGDYDFGPRRYISAAPFWRTPDPKAHDYPNTSPYAFCAANPIRYADPTGCKIEGVRKEDAANAVQDLRAMFVGDEFAAFRELIVQSGKKQNGKSLAPISQEALAKALDGANLNADQQALVEMTVNTINSDDKHVVEYRELSEKISSEGEMLLRPTLDADYLAYFAQFDSDGLRMQTVYNVRGDGATIGKQRGSYSIINANAQYRPAISAHEIIGHGRALSLGRYDTQLEDAITTENLVYRTMGIPYINNGSSHQGSNGKPLKKCSSLPGFR